jgi:hypothetical protein
MIKLFPKLYVINPSPHPSESINNPKSIRDQIPFHSAVTFLSINQPIPSLPSPQLVFFFFLSYFQNKATNKFIDPNSDLPPFLFFQIPEIQKFLERKPFLTLPPPHPDVSSRSVPNTRVRRKLRKHSENSDRENCKFRDIPDRIIGFTARKTLSFMAKCSGARFECSVDPFLINLIDSVGSREISSMGETKKNLRLEIELGNFRRRGFCQKKSAGRFWIGKMIRSGKMNKEFC